MIIFERPTNGSYSIHSLLDGDIGLSVYHFDLQ